MVTQLVQALTWIAQLTKAWTVSFKRVALDFNPDNAHEPGTPIYPNQPNGPKWPAKDAYLKDVTYTVHYTSKNRNAKLPADSVQKAQWKRSLTLDSVTGDILTAGEWKADKTKFDLVIIPLVNGYFADKGVWLLKMSLWTTRLKLLLTLNLVRLLPLTKKVIQSQVLKQLLTQMILTIQLRLP